MAPLRSNPSKGHKPRRVPKRGSIRALAELEPHQSAELREFFRLIDTNNKGVIEKEYLRTMLTLWNGSAPTEECLDEMLNDTCGVPLNITLFLTLFAQKLRDVDSPETINHAFQCMDIDNSGTINAQELRVWLVTKGDCLTDAEVDEIFSRMTIKDGRLEYDAFVKMFQNIQL
uniref:EF-hand domain-containing protein n=1 Tax=Anopheles culicifacies TaxID=139723 RepID=A0A182LYW5_9DIPT